MPVIDDILDENLILASRFDEHTVPRSQTPARHLAVVGCMDGRLDLPAILDLKTGDAHVIRNAGGVATDDVIRSLVVSQRTPGDPRRDAGAPHGLRHAELPRRRAEG